MSSKNIINSGKMKRTNRLLVLSLLRNSKPMSRVDITRRLKCDGTTTTNIIRSLFRSNLLISCGTPRKTKVGRPTELVTLNPDSRLAIGISFEPPSLIGIVTGLTGKIRFCEKIHLGPVISPEEFTVTVRNLAGNLISKTDRKNLLGIGISTFGVLHPEEHKVIHSKYFPAIEDFSFTEMFKDEFKIVPEIIDGTYAKALAEINFSATAEKKETKNFILVNAGTGLALLNVCDGVPRLGAYGHVGEFGHTIIDPNGKKCFCGRNGCLETFCSIGTIEAEISESLKQNLDFIKIVKLFKEGNSKVETAISRNATILGKAIGNILTLMPAEEIIFTGRLMELGDKYFSLIDENIRKTAFPIFMQKAKISKSKQPAENAALGACSIILKSFFDGGASA